MKANNLDTVKEDNNPTEIIVQANEPTKLNDDITVTLLAYYAENSYMWWIRAGGDASLFESLMMEHDKGFISVFFKVEYTGQTEMSLDYFGSIRENEKSIMPDFYIIKDGTKSLLGGQFYNEFGEEAANDYLLTGGTAICLVSLRTTIPDEGVPDLNTYSVSTTINDTNYIFKLENALEAPDTEVFSAFG